MDSHRRACAG